MDSSFQRLRATRSEVSLRRKPAAPTVTRPAPAPTFPLHLAAKAAQHPSHIANSSNRPPVAQSTVRPVAGPKYSEYKDGEDEVESWIDEYASRQDAKPIPPLPLRLPVRGTAPAAQYAATCSVDDLPGLSPSTRARPGAFLSKSRPTTPVSISPITPTSEIDIFPPRDTIPTTSAECIETDATGAPKKGFWKNAADETAFFASGLISHPAESTRHFTILRHSPGLIMYRGAETSVSVSIFATEPLPRDRTLWLQQRGFSGDRGMKLKTLVGATGSWIDVTPASRAMPDAVPEGDERAFQRDGAKWLKKAARDRGRTGRHAWRETQVVRIPAAANDGYFRLVLCTSSSSSGSSYQTDGERPPKKKVLCASPVFRIASTSTDSSVLRGASVTTMPLEVALKVGSTVGVAYASKYTKPAALVAGTVQGRVAKTVESKVKHSAAIQKAGKAAYIHTGLRDHVDASGRRYAEVRGGRYDVLGQPATAVDDETVGPDGGPEDPYPLEFSGKVVRGTGRGRAELGIPTANLDDVPEGMRLRLRGVYFGWACVVGGRKGLDRSVSLDWHEAIINVGPSAHAAPSVAARPMVAVHLLHDFGGQGAAAAASVLLDSRLKVMVMGYLRPRLARDSTAEEQVSHFATDRMLATNSLAREGWGPEMARELVEAQRGARTFSDRLVGARDRAQLQMDRVPLHLLGVRTEAAGLMDRIHGNGGYWIPR